MINNMANIRNERVIAENVAVAAVRAEERAIKTG